MYVACLIICAPHACSVLSGQKGVLEPLERELGWVLYPPPTLRATNAPNCRASSPALRFLYFQVYFIPIQSLVYVDLRVSCFNPVR